MHCSPAEEMQVDMKDGLPRRRVRIHDRAIAARRDALFPRDLGGHERKSTEQLGVSRLIQTGNVLPRNHQHV